MSFSEYGIVLGRFQPFHIGHMEYFKAAKERCQHLVVGITNPDLTELRHHTSDPNRSKSQSNPFSFFERLEIIRSALGTAGWGLDSFSIVPNDLEGTKKRGAFLPDHDKSKVFLTIYDAWGEEKAKRVLDQQFAIEILWRRTMNERATSGAEIREKIRCGHSWKHLILPGTAQYIADRIDRIRKP